MLLALPIAVKQSDFYCSVEKKAPQDERNLCNKCSELHFYSFAKNFNKEDKFIYIICNLDKLKKSDVSPVEEENERDETYQASSKIFFALYSAVDKCSTPLPDLPRSNPYF